MHKCHFYHVYQGPRKHVFEIYTDGIGIKSVLPLLTTSLLAQRMQKAACRCGFLVETSDDWSDVIEHVTVLCHVPAGRN